MRVESLSLVAFLVDVSVGDLAPGEVDPESRLLRRLLRRTLVADPCVWCGGPGGTIEHVLPRAMGGLSEWTNIVGACRACNERRGALPWLEYLLVRDEIAAAGRRRVKRRGLVPASHSDPGSRSSFG